MPPDKAKSTRAGKPATSKAKPKKTDAKKPKPSRKANSVAGPEIGRAPAAPRDGNFPILGLGASAGGLEALKQFFEAMPSDSGMAFLVVMHLDPDHASILPELIQRHTAMEVVAAATKCA